MSEQELRLAAYQERLSALFDRTVQKGQLFPTECQHLKDVIRLLSFNEITVLMACSGAIAMTSLNERRS